MFDPDKVIYRGVIVRNGIPSLLEVDQNGHDRISMVFGGTAVVGDGFLKEYEIVERTPRTGVIGLYDAVQLLEAEIITGGCTDG